MSKKLTIVNFVGFQTAWFACVIGSAHQHPWLGVFVTVVFAIWHLSQATQKNKELKLLLFTLIIGGIFDQTLLTNGLIQYADHGWGNLNSLVPVWILALWIGFATSLNVSLRWMHGKLLWSILFGLIGGPLAYLGAEKLGAVTITQDLSMMILGMGWAIIFPCLLFISSKFDGFKDQFT